MLKQSIKFKIEPNLFSVVKLKEYPIKMDILFDEVLKHENDAEYWRKISMAKFSEAIGIGTMTVYNWLMTSMGIGFTELKVFAEYSINE